MPAPDDLDRDRFYASDDDDGEEYELEGPDPEVLAAEQRRAEETKAAIHRSIDIDEIYRDDEHSRSSEILNEWVQDFRGGFRFRVKHLLIATAVVAIGLTLWRLKLLGTAVVLGAMFSVIGVYLYLQWKEKQHQDAAAARRHDLYARRRAAQLNAGKPDATAPTRERPAAQQPAPPSQEETDRMWQEATKAQEFEFRFSLGQMLLAITGAAVVLGLVSIFGAQNSATLLGFIALGGLVLHAVGYQPPAMLALGWWLLLLMYVLLSFFTVIWSAV